MLHADQINESKRCGGLLTAAESAGVITDAMVAAQATITLLKAEVLAPTGAILRSDQAPLAREVCAALARAKSLAEISETHGETTVAALAALTEAPAGFKQSFF